jgi:predicted Rossmann fold nucleotide-binding protein DprA/Smf involved in DNA uptake
MDPVHIHKNDSCYPSRLPQMLGERAPNYITALGNLDILRREMTGLFCSVKCPGNVILLVYDLAREWQRTEVTVISGFHSPIEKECLALLLRGAQPIVICPARSIEGMRVPAVWKRPIADGRLLVLSPFAAPVNRATTKLTQVRNEFVAALADRVFIAYASFGGKTEAFARAVVNWGKPLMTVASPDNESLLALGAVAVATQT